MTKLLITGGAGFIGSNLVHYLFRTHTSHQFVIVDKLTYAGNLMNLDPLLSSPRVEFLQLDICDQAVEDAMDGCDAVLHLAAESHVDRSIENAAAFIKTNVEGSWNLVECARRKHVRRFVQVSTDEVYGSLGPTGKFTEYSPINPSSPYSACKAASDLLVLAMVRTHRFPGLVTRCSNNYGPYQFPEKFIPRMISQAIAKKPMPIYGDGLNVRNWIHVEDHCAALDLILHHGEEGEVYNIGGPTELSNIEVAKQILQFTQRGADLLQFVPDRPGHDRRYAIDSTKLERSLGWKAAWDFERGLKHTIEWYCRESRWLECAKNADQQFFTRQYARSQVVGGTY